MQETARNMSLLDQLPDKTIVLVGMMGVGKTTVGRRLATQLQLPFCDADEEIEKASGMKIADYFALYGEEAFRKGERRVIKRLLSEPRHILATGGGAFADPKTRKLLKDKAITIWLKADITTLVKRTSLRDTRPLLRDGDAQKILERLLKQREPLYAEADLTINSATGSHKATINLIIAALEQLQQVADQPHNKENIETIQ
ncbi:MAG: shikimate kinase [bacterium]